jgi:DNA polymerase-1
MAEQFDAIFKKAEPQQLTLLPKKLNYTKAHSRKEEQFDLLQVLYQRASDETRHQYYNTLENTEHSYQIIKVTWVSKLLYNLLKQESVCFDTETTGLDALHANLSVFHFIRKGKRLLCSFPENKEKLKF